MACQRIRSVALILGALQLMHPRETRAETGEGAAVPTSARRVQFGAGARIGAAQRTIIVPPEGPLAYETPWSAAYGLDIELRARLGRRRPWWLRGRASMSASMGWHAKLSGDVGSEQVLPLRHQYWGLGVALDRDIPGDRLFWRISPGFGYGFLPVFSHVEHAIPNYLMHGPHLSFALAVEPNRWRRLQVWLRPQAQVLTPDRGLQDAYAGSRRTPPAAQINLGVAAGLRLRILAHLALAISWESHRGLVDVGMPDRLRRAAWFTLAFDDLH